MSKWNKFRSDPLLGVVAGACGGFIASWAMNQFQAAWSKLAQEKPFQEAGDDATVKTAQAISENVFGHELSEREKKWAGPALHFGFGTTVGALYGALAEQSDAIKAGRGAGYGAAVWLLGDEIAVPAAGLAPPASETPVIGHVKALASHLVYGAVTELVRGWMRR